MLSHPPRLRGGLVANSVLLSIVLVVVTTVAVAAVLVQAVSRQVEQAADRRLVDAAVLFRSLLDDNRDELLAVGDWLVHDQDLLAAVEANSFEAIQERLAFSFRLRSIDDVLVAMEDGSVAAHLRVDVPLEQSSNIASEPGFRQAIAGRTVDGIDRGESYLRQQVYMPIRYPDSEQPETILRIAAFVENDELEKFRAQTGLNASLFFGQTRVATTLRQSSGRPLLDVGADPSIYRQVVGEGQELLAWRDLPTVRVRAYYLPLTGPDGDRVGMVSISMPVTTIQEQLGQAVLPVAPVGLAILVLGGSLAYLLARRVRQPVLLLAAAAERLRQGDFSTPIPSVREQELVPLAEQLEQARASVKTQMETIANAEQRLRTVFAMLGEPVLTTSADGVIVGSNLKAVELFASDRLAGRSIRSLLPFLTAPDPETERATWQGSIVDPSNRYLDLEVHLTRLRDGKLPASDIYVIYDVSRHVEVSRFREQLLYNVAHEIRGPLAVMDSALEILGTEYDDLNTAEYERLLGTARRTAVRLRSVMEDLLSAGSIQAGRLTLSLAPASLSAILQEALELVGPTLEERGQIVACEPAGNGFLVQADRRYIRQVLSNLLSNASKYGPNNTPVRVMMEKTGDAVRVSVHDSGPGIPREQQEGLFERFFRVRSYAEGPGIGLGLAIAKGIVEAHGGEIGLESEAGAGTTVWFTLPEAPEAGS